MTTKNSSSGNENNSKGTANSHTGKKTKSAGFIESTNFKPTWLETGPLSPDMLPEPTAEQESSQLTPDEFEALQDSLQRFYGEASGDTQPKALSTAPADTSSNASSMEAHAIPEVEPSLSTTTEAAAVPEAWITPLINRDAGSPAQPGTLAPPTQPDITWDAPPAVQFVEETPLMTTTIPAATSRPDSESNQSGKATQPKTKRRRDRLSWGLLITSLLLLSAAALIYFVNPFSRIALGAASLARPVTSPTTPAPTTGSGAWCLSGEFLSDTADMPRLIDSGASGDILAEDLIFSLDYPIASPGTHEWQVVDCSNETLAYPAAPAWVITTEPNQTVTFNFDSNERADPLFFPIPYVVSATDDTEDFQVIGTFQDWNADDASGKLQRLNLGLYQQVRRIARSGSYEAYVIAGDPQHAIDAYGRTTDPIPFSFTTDRNGDYVVFLVDTDRGRASVMYDMPPVLTSLAYGNGNWMMSGALVALAGLLLLGMIFRWLILHNKNLQMDAGCPSCGRHELMRIARRPGDRALHRVGIPAYRYRCRHCTWEGTRLSEEGATISAGVPLAYYEGN